MTTTLLDRIAEALREFNDADIHARTPDIDIRANTPGMLAEYDALKAQIRTDNTETLRNALARARMADAYKQAIAEFRAWGSVDDADAIERRAKEICEGKA